MLEPTKSGKNYQHYNVQNQSSLAGPEGSEIIVGDDKKRQFKLKVDTQGGLEIVANKEEVKLFLSEIREAKAQTIREKHVCWILQREYILR
ncbi:hypothetical protein KW805_02970 [Candidatus Pacearchaeota archaeon]|nr:hypothetical protein [Candidatus Pacearchaeota archaeon]